MSLETRPPRRLPDSAQDKPRIDRTEHGNLERAYARRHPCAPAGQDPARQSGWTPYLQQGRGWH